MSEKKRMEIKPPFSLTRAKTTFMGEQNDVAISDAQGIHFGEIWADSAIQKGNPSPIKLDAQQIAEKICRILNENWEKY